MACTEVQRTLVKSPPELWAELSDPVSLARHLGELGEIRLTHVEPESAVEWEAEQVKGSVQLKPSGWGTRVTFSVTRDLPEPAEEELVAEVPVASEAPAEESAAEEPVAMGQVETESTAAEPEEPQEVQPPAKRRGFFARLFRRRRTDRTVDPGTMPAVAVVEEALEIEVEATSGAVEEIEPLVEQPAEETPEVPAAFDAPDLAAELASIEQEMVERDTAILTAVLDRLGAAHHRPFSRG